MLPHVSRLPEMESQFVRLLEAPHVDVAAWYVLERKVRSRTKYPSGSVEPAEGFVQLALATWHCNGHIREAALKQLAAKYPDQAAPLFLLRLHDWVPPIYLLADAWIAAHPAATLKWLPLVAAELEKQRPTGSAAWPAIRTLLLRDPGLVRSAPNLVGHMVAHDAPAPALEVWLRLPYASARLHAARYVLQRPELVGLRPHLWQDPSPKIRALDLQWERALFDPSRLVRERAIFACKQAGHNPAQIFRAAGTELAAAGLAQCAEPQDVSFFEARLGAQFPRQRVEALEALARLQPDSARRHALRLLDDDPSLRVRRTALRLLGTDIGEDRIVQLASGPPTGLRNDAWRLLRQHYPWQELLWLLVGNDAARLRSWLLRFWRRSWLRPPAHLAADLAAAWQQNTWLTESERQHLSFLSAR